MLDAQTCAGNHRMARRQPDVQGDVLVRVAAHWEQLVRIIVRVPLDAPEIAIECVGNVAYTSGATVPRILGVRRQRLQKVAFLSLVEFARQQWVACPVLPLSNRIDCGAKRLRRDVVLTRRLENVGFDQIGRGQAAGRRLDQRTTGALAGLAEHPWFSYALI